MAESKIKSNGGWEFIYPNLIVDTDGSNYTVLNMSNYRKIIIMTFRYNNCFSIDSIDYNYFIMLCIDNFPQQSAAGSLQTYNNLGESSSVAYVNDTTVKVKTSNSYTGVYLLGEK